MKSKPKEHRSKYSEHFEQIKATPERVAEVIMKSPARKTDEWWYKKNLGKAG